MMMIMMMMMMMMIFIMVPLSSEPISQLSMSEKLAKLAHKIDFLSDVRGQEEDIDKEDEEKSLVTFQPSLWPWDSVRENLR